MSSTEGTGWAIRMPRSPAVWAATEAPLAVSASNANKDDATIPAMPDRPRCEDEPRSPKTGSWRLMTYVAQRLQRQWSRTVAGR
jgi:hypothetical protein